MTSWIRPYNIGCELSPSIPAETVLQDGWETYLLFFAVSKAVDESGSLEDLGVAVVKCQQCMMAKFGYPNDEGLPEHPLYEFGLDTASSSVLEVVDSPWASELFGQRIASARRIRPQRRCDWIDADQHRHFIVPLKAATFESIASALTVEAYYKTFGEAYAHAIRKFREH